jgi:hypothetical protein
LYRFLGRDGQWASPPFFRKVAVDTDSIHAVQDDAAGAVERGPAGGLVHHQPPPREAFHARTSPSNSATRLAERPASRAVSESLVPSSSTFWASR